MGAAPAPAAPAAPAVSPTASIVPTLSLNGPSSITVPANQVYCHSFGEAPHSIALELRPSCFQLVLHSPLNLCDMPLLFSLDIIDS